nr:hypothetical protein [Corynebacterium auriscanis]
MITTVNGVNTPSRTALLTLGIMGIAMAVVAAVLAWFARHPRPSVAVAESNTQPTRAE